jgi:hypothetical protein
VTCLTKGNDRIRDTVVAIPRTTTGFHCDNNTRQLVSYSPAAEEVSVYASAIVFNVIVSCVAAINLHSE